MKRFLICFIAILGIFVLNKAVLAADNPTQKFGRGIANIVTAPVEIAKQVDQEWKKSSEDKKNTGIGVAKGFVKGLAFTIGRFGSGLWDVVTFPLQTPKNYEPLMKPDYVLQKEEPPTAAESNPVPQEAQSLEPAVK